MVDPYRRRGAGSHYHRGEGARSRVVELERAWAGESLCYTAATTRGGVARAERGGAERAGGGRREGGGGEGGQASAGGEWEG